MTKQSGEANRTRSHSGVAVLGRAAIAAAAVLTVAGLPSSVAWAQPAGEERPASNSQLLADFTHYVNIDNYVLAKSMAAELLSKNLDGPALVKLVEQGEQLDRFEAATAKALRVADLEDVASRLLKLYTSGKLAIARDPAQIAQAIGMLTGTARGRILAEERLKVAGEYAVPQLLESLTNNKDAVLASEVRQVLIAMGPRAVAPLCVALGGLDGVNQERVIDILGAVAYPASLPYIAEVNAATSNKAVKSACERALAKFGADGGRSPAELFTALAERYYNELSDVTSFPGEEFQLLWSFSPQTGLAMNAIRTSVFHEAMAMRCAERALTLNSSDPETLALWVAANLKREIETPEGYTNPAYGEEKKDAMYFAIASGAQVQQRVLARATDAKNTPLARKAIAALGRSAGGSSLWSSGLSRQPLLESLSYPNRRVQYEAALVLASASPKESFSGSERVVPILAGCIREAADRYAVVSASSVEVYQAVRPVIERLGYRVLPFGRTLGEIALPLAEAPAVDLVVAANLGGERTQAFLGEARANPKLAATPILALAEQSDVADLRKRFMGDSGLAIRSSAVGEEAIANTVRELTGAVSGGDITSDEATSYSNAALAALRELAVSGNGVLRVADVAPSLIGSLGDKRLNVRIDVAEVLSRIDSTETQRAIAEAAVNASGAERIVMLGKLADSAKRFGNKVEERHVTRLREMAMGQDREESTAAAAVLGALDLPNSQLLPLITGKPQRVW